MRMICKVAPHCAARRVAVAAFALCLAASMLTGCASDEDDAPIITSNGGESELVDDGEQKAEDEAVAILSDPAIEDAVCAIEYMGNDVSFFDGLTGDSIGRVHVGVNPAAIAISSDGMYAYIANSGSGEVVRLGLGEQASIEKVRVGTQPMALALDEERGLLYVADYHLNSIRIMDTALMSLVDVIDLEPKGFENREMAPACCTSPLDGTVLEGRKPVSLAISPDGSTLYCANIGTYDVSRIDLEAREELDPFDGVIGFRDVVITQDGKYLLLAGVGSELIESPDLIALDAKTGEEVAAVFVGQEVSGVACSPDGSRALAVSKAEGVVASIDLGTWEVQKTLSLDAGITDVSIDASGSCAYVGNSDTGVLTCIDLDSMEIVFEVDGLADPRFVMAID